MKMSNFEDVFVKTDVACVKVYNNCILAGVGNKIYVYKTSGEFLKCQQIFESTRIHTIFTSETGRVGICGTYNLCVYKLEVPYPCVFVAEFAASFPDWIMAGKWMNSDTSLLLIFGKNNGIYLSNNFESREHVSCMKTGMIKSAVIINSERANAVVAAGSLHGNILMWKTNYKNNPLLMELTGHEGTIHGLAYSENMMRLASVGDDRAVRLWSLHPSLTGFHLDQVMYGHKTRIFSCTFADDYVVSVGEDSSVHLWSLTGKLVREIEAHTGGTIWSVDYSTTEKMLVTGGSDGGISMHVLQLTDDVTQLGEFYLPPKYVFMAANSLIGINTECELLVYSEASNAWEMVAARDFPLFYMVFAVSPSRKLFCLAGLNGALAMYKDGHTGVDQCFWRESHVSGRIHWMTFLEEHLLLVAVQNQIELWKIDDSYSGRLPTFMYFFLLEQHKEPWPTAACKFSENLFVIADKRSNMYLYKYGTHSYIHVLRNTHSYLGIFKLVKREGLIYSCGRDGYVNKYDIQNEELVKVASDRVLVQWVCDIIERNGLPYLIGFTGKEFIVYDYIKRVVLRRFSCGSGHRSWTIRQNGSHMDFIFIKSKQVHSFSINWNHLIPPPLLQGFHPRMIHCIKKVKVPNRNGKYLMVSGGEDTTCRISEFDLANPGAGLSYVCAFKAHLSSIRSILVTSINEKNHYVFTGGGRTQLVLHKIKFVGDCEIPACILLDSFYMHDSDSIGETRIMDMTHFGCYLVAACSNAELKCFSISPLEKIKYLGVCHYNARCFLKVDSFQLNEKLYVVSGSGDGLILIWDFTPFLVADIEPADFVTFRPVYVGNQHQTGVNALYVKVLSDNKVLIVSGSDDNSVSLLCLNFREDEISVLYSQLYSCLHFAKVVNVTIRNNYLITVSMDQSVTALPVDLSNGTVFNDNKYVCTSVIPNIRGAEYFEENGNLTLCMYGHGVQILQVLPASNNH